MPEREESTMLIVQTADVLAQQQASLGAANRTKGVGRSENGLVFQV